MMSHTNFSRNCRSNQGKKCDKTVSLQLSLEGSKFNEVGINDLVHYENWIEREVKLIKDRSSKIECKMEHQIEAV